MFRNTSVKKSLILLVALVLGVSICLAACSAADFKPVSAPAAAEVKDNGGIAVQYGEWLYYINGYNSDANSENTYSDQVKDTPRLGSVVRIKFADIDKLFEIQDDSNKTSTERSDEIAQYVRDHAETVVPKIYYSGNTTTTQFTGLYIFNDRLYITTPNDQLTPGGASQTSQLVLASYKLDGSDEQRHFTFTDNTAQIYFSQKDNALVATYVMGSKLYNLNVASGVSTEISVDKEDEFGKGDYADYADVDNVYNSINWDADSNCLYFIDKFFHICKLTLGESTYKTVVAEEGNFDVHEHDGETSLEAGTVSYTISAVNNGQVYFTRTDSENPLPNSTNPPKIYWAAEGSESKVALDTSSLSGAKPWKNGRMVFTKTIADGSSTFYGIYATQEDDPAGEKAVTVILLPISNDSSVTIDRIEGDTLFYTANSVNYTLDLNTPNQKNGTPYAKSIPSATGWAAPDLLDYVNGDVTVHYIISASSGLSISKFDPENPNATAVSVSIQLVAKVAEEEA